MSRPDPTAERAFTLVELLIVIGLISLLMVALVPNLLTPGEQARRAETMARLQHLRMCITTYERKNGQYPPSRFADADKDVKVKNNGVNEGIECLLVHLHRRSLGRAATLEDKADWLQNTDKDDGGFLIPLLQTTKLFEVVDAWGCPVAYFREDTYGQAQTILMAGEDEAQETASALRNPRTAAFMNPRSFQLISAGPDGVFGNDDDVSIPRRPVSED